nr:MAG TPA: hypothetical protein [Caudoviricetes sp.]
MSHRKFPRRGRAFGRSQSCPAPRFAPSSKTFWS